MTKLSLQDTQRREKTVRWFHHLRDRLCETLEALENTAENDAFEIDAEAEKPAGKFHRKAWRREDASGGDGDDDGDDGNGNGDGGGGEMSVMRGRVFEKVGVNVSTVYGTFAPELQREVKGAAQDGRFWASGISVVAHPCSPRVPAVHFNTRYIHSAHGWFGGGGDLTPNEDDPVMRDLFHDAFRQVCDKYEQGRYEIYAKACDAYFTIHHRNRARGAGGIFFDGLKQNWQRDFDFVRDTGEAFLEVFPKIVRARVNLPWSAEQRAQQLRVRGYYAEFNLVYDRGTRFGLLTKGNPEAVLMSLPPLAAW